MGVIITAVKITPNPVKAGEKYTVEVTVKETVQEPVMYRLPFKLGTKKGGIK